MVAPAERADGRSFVLKVPYPDSESRSEPDGLRLWDGDGVVRLLEWDDVTRALLLERLRPGTSLWAVDIERMYDEHGQPFDPARLENVVWCYESGEAVDDDLALVVALA